MKLEMTSPFKRPFQVCVVGAGYVGLTASACIAHLGHTVRCLEIDRRKLEVLRCGGIPLEEPGLKELVIEGMTSARLSFSSNVSETVPGADIVLLCVGTPSRPDGEPDLRYLAGAAEEVSRAATGPLVVVVKSTVPPGSCEAIELICREVAPEGVKIDVVSSPEFLRESHAVEDFLHPDRVVVGAENEETAQIVAALYPPGVPLLMCDRRAAELVKYAANAYLAVKISFANEVAALCENLGTDASSVLLGVGLDNRIGAEFLRPGPGYGGSCLPKDVAGFQALGRAMNVPTPVVSAAEETNSRAIGGVISKLLLGLGGLEGRHIAVLGLAFKAGTDDTRFSPAIALVERLAMRGARVKVYDPLARVCNLPAVRVRNPMEAIRGAHATVLATGWEEFRSLDPQAVASAMIGDTLVDSVGILEIASYESAGLVVYGIGRGRPTVFHPVVWPPLRWARLEYDPSSESEARTIA